MSIVLKSTEMSGNNIRETIISPSASPGPQIVTVDTDSSEPTMPYGFGRQVPFILSILNDMTLPTNPFNTPATTALLGPTANGLDKNYSPYSPESSEPSPISTSPMNLNTVE